MNLYLNVQPTNLIQYTCLALALCDILLQARGSSGRSKEVIVCLASKGSTTERLDLSQRLLLYKISESSTLKQFIMANIEEVLIT